MANPDAPSAASFPIPPPAFNFPWGTVGANGTVMLTPMSIEFLQLLWASIQGGGGVIDLVLAALSSSASVEAEVLGLLAADPRIAAALGAMRGEVARLDAAIEAAVVLALQRPPTLPQPPADITYGLVSSENLAASTLVNVWSDGGAFHAREADTTDTLANAHEAHGFVRQACTSGDTALVVFSGVLTGLSGLTPGPAYLGPTGTVTSTPNVTPGQISQQVGIAVAADTLIFQPQPAVGI